jgi:Icc-related predicted phosphoesterase
MKIQIASDLHLDLLEARFPDYRAVEPADADVLVIAGDIHRHTKAIAAFADWPVPVIYVHGNHEAYHEQYEDLIGALRAASAHGNVHFLECGEQVIDKVRFLGCCLWTDYQLNGADSADAMREAGRALRDHQVITTAHGAFTPDDALQIHRQSRAWLQQKLDETFDGQTVVVTHHAPHPQSIHPRFAGLPLNAAFISDLTPLMGKAALWVHGHVHDSFDYFVNGTRVIANPRGYAANRRTAATPAQLDWENPRFDPRLVIEI